MPNPMISRLDGHGEVLNLIMKDFLSPILKSVEEIRLELGEVARDVRSTTGTLNAITKEKRFLSQEESDALSTNRLKSAGDADGVSVNHVFDERQKNFKQAKKLVEATGGMGDDVTNQTLEPKVPHDTLKDSHPADSNGALPDTSAEQENQDFLKLKLAKDKSHPLFDAHLDVLDEKHGCVHDELVPNMCTILVEHKYFKIIAAALIMANCVFVGVEVDMDIKTVVERGTRMESDVLTWIGHSFAVLFSIELIVRICAYRKHFWGGEEWKWNWFDTVLVLSGFVELVFSGVRGLNALRVLRTLRIARTLRILRVITIFRNLQLIMQGLFESFLSLLWTLLILFLCLYLIAILFVAAVTTHMVETPVGETNVINGDGLSDEELREAFYRHFRTLPRAMLSVFFCVTGGVDWYDVVQPIMHVSYVYVMIFALFITFVVFGVFNALNACFVESVLHNRDKELLIQAENMKVKGFLKDMYALFKEADQDGGGSLSKEELEEYCKNPRFCAYLSTHTLDASDAKSLFEFLDEDGSGEVEVEEFAMGTLKLKGPARCLDILKLQVLLTRLNASLAEVRSVLPKH